MAGKGLMMTIPEWKRVSLLINEFFLCLKSSILGRMLRVGCHLLAHILLRPVYSRFLLLLSTSLRNKRYPWIAAFLYLVYSQVTLNMTAALGQLFSF